MNKMNSMLLVSALGLVLCSDGQKSNEYTDFKQVNSIRTASVSTVKTGKILISKENVYSKLKKYLPQKVLANMPNFRQQDMNGSTLYLWSKKEPKSDNFIHKIELTFNENGFKTYHYKSYSFPLKENKISKSVAKKMVENFAKDFISGGDKLSFVNKPTYFSLYEKGVVESWVAEKNNKEYIVMVNLKYGYVEFFKAEDKSK